MADGRTIWWGKDIAWWRRERVVALGEDFGADGPAVIDWLSCEAKAQNDGGLVKTGVRSISRGCFVDRETVSHVLSRAVTLCLLDEFEQAGEVITCRISGFKADDVKAQAAARQAKKRTKDAESEDACHDLSHPVTPSHKKSLREEKRSTTAPLAPHGGQSLPQPPTGNRRTDRERYRMACRQVAARLFPDGPADSAEYCVDQALRRGVGDEAEIRDHARRWFPDLRQGVSA